jgi:M6 family metalloprotease-like protein
VDLGGSGVDFRDIDFAIAEGPRFAALSPSVDDTFDPLHPHVMLLAGPFAGTFTLEARDQAGNALASAPFSITDKWAESDGPPMAFTGANPLYASGGAWGSTVNGSWPFTYGPDAVAGTRRVVLIFVNTADTQLPGGTEAAYRAGLAGGVLRPDGVSRSVRAYYEEVSHGKLDIVAAGEVTVTLTRPWADYHAKFSATDDRFAAKHDLIEEAMSLAQHSINFRDDVDTAVFVTASPNGGLPVSPDTLKRFSWPIANGGAYLLSQPTPVGFPVGWYYKSLPWTVMPAEWETVDTRRIFQTLTHEIGHTIGLQDLYGDSRAVQGWDVMSDDGPLPALCLPHRLVLGWVDGTWLRNYNFIAGNRVDEEVRLAATEQLRNGLPAGQRAGLEIEVGDGWRYYFEYRSRQNTTGADPEPTQVADQFLPADRRVVGTDVKAGWYHPPISRAPIRLLADDGDGEGVALTIGQDYEEPDPDGKATFRLQVLEADDDQALVHVTYQPTPAPEPPWPNGVDPAIRPWPGGGIWQSPDIRLSNGSGLSIPWANHYNTVTATIKNAGSIDATGIRVGFWVKDFTVSADGPETLLGWVFGDIAAGASRDFHVGWVPPASATIGGGIGYAHYCLAVRISPHSQGSPPRGEVSYDNNEAQSNYTIVFTVEGSPFTRQRIPVHVANPYSDRAVQVHLHAEQRLHWYRTYLEYRSVTLAPGETRDVELMVECVANEPAFKDRVPLGALYGEANVVTAIATVLDPGSDVVQTIGGATIEVRAARAATLNALDVSRTGASGRITLVSDGTPVPAGGNVVVTGWDNAGKELSHHGRTAGDGRFTVNTSSFAALPTASTVEITYVGAPGVGPTSTKVNLP